MSTVVAGLSTAGHSVISVTDEDAIASNQTQLAKLATAFGNMAGTYSSGRVKSVRVGTTASDIELEMEDIAAVPDLAAGALSDLLTKLHERGVRWPTPLTLVAPDDLPAKARQILHWLRARGQPLRRLVFAVGKGTATGDINITQPNFS